jgi:inorganic pyrophosphatase
MSNDSGDRPEPFWEVLSLLYKPHPWHGIDVGKMAPEKVNAYIEIVPTDTVKYELDKTTGYLKIDRPQKFSNVYPTLYGFIPRTYCGEESGDLCAKRTGRTGIKGDGDPLDICVLSEKVITHGDVILEAIPIGGLRMIDGDEADDKIIAVLDGDAIYGLWREISQMPPAMLERLKHYFLTYKHNPDSLQPEHVAITHVYGREEAYEVIRRSRVDYDTRFKDLRQMMTAALKG